MVNDVAVCWGTAGIGNGGLIVIYDCRCQVQWLACTSRIAPQITRILVKLTSLLRLWY